MYSRAPVRPITRGMLTYAMPHAGILHNVAILAPTSSAWHVSKPNHSAAACLSRWDAAVDPINPVAPSIDSSDVHRSSASVPTIPANILCTIPFTGRSYLRYPCCWAPFASAMAASRPPREPYGISRTHKAHYPIFHSSPAWSSKSGGAKLDYKQPKLMDLVIKVCVVGFSNLERSHVPHAP
jgi:hypothetical protein